MENIPNDIPLKELLNSVGVEVTPYNGRGVTLIDSKTKEKLHKTPYASYELGQDIYLERVRSRHV